MLSFREFLERFGETYQPTMRYAGDSSPQGARHWQERFRAKLEELSGEPFGVKYCEAGTPPGERKVEVVERRELADHVRERVLIESVLGTTVPAYVLLPKEAGGGPRPGLLVLHGHTRQGKEAMAGVAEGGGEGPPADHARAAVRAGFVVLTPDWWGFGERAEEGFDFGGRDPCNVKFMAAQMYGVVLLTLMIQDGRAALETLLSRPEVDSERVGVMGNSFGGRMSMYLSAFDGRIRAAAASGCLNCFRERSLGLTSCGAQFFPGMLRFGDVEDVFGLIAPRPLMIVVGRKDPLLPEKYRERMKPVIQWVYRALGAEENLVFHEHDGGHFLPQKPVLEWLRGHLMKD